MKLVIVESPTKAKTISRFLGRDFKVESSYGHVRDLPKSSLGVEVEKNFEPKYIIPAKSRKAVNQLKKAAAAAEKIILATDEDREGEAIAWHLTQALELPNSKIERIVFHEITERAIKGALSNPREIDHKLVDSQQARRLLDRLVGYKLSPFLWKKIYRGLSAGRVQSAALRLAAEREREIQHFKPEEYWTLSALLETREKESLEANLQKSDLKTKTEIDKILKELEGAAWQVENIEKRAVTRKVPAPFTTSTLQQEAFRRFGFSAKQTMLLAQQLYEGIELGEGPVGLVTYMRTDSLNLSEESLRQAGEFLKNNLGENYALTSPRRFQTKSKLAQEAHEAIRPTEPGRIPDTVQKFLNSGQFKLYELIWRRYLASQMPEAVFDATWVEIKAGEYDFRAQGQVMKFDGFLKMYPLRFSEVILPELKPGEELKLLEFRPRQHFTEPPPRFSDASLVKTLEKYGIGRPSTYAPIISTLVERGYVERIEKKRLKPTEVGLAVNDLLVKHFPEIVDIQFTAHLEEDLDEIALGKKEWRPIIKEFYEPFAKHLEEKYESVKKQEFSESTDEVCEKCGKPLVIKRGRFGRFLACSGFPECKNTKPLPPVSLNLKCPKCQEGEIVERNTKRGGRIFYGCSRWPKCDFASWQRPNGQTCPQCSSYLVLTKNGMKCSSKSCDYEARGISGKTPSL